MTTITTNINKDKNNNNTDQWMDLAIDTTEKSNTTTLMHGIFNANIVKKMLQYN